MDIYQASEGYIGRFQGFNLETGVPTAEQSSKAMQELLELAAQSELPANGRLRYLDQVVAEMAPLAPVSATLFNKAIVDNPGQRELAKTLEIALATIAKRSPETLQHIMHHTALTMLYYERQKAATKAPTPPQELLTLLVGALGHDFGKIGIDPQLLHKATRVEPGRFAAALAHYQQSVANYPEKAHEMMFLEQANQGKIIFAKPDEAKPSDAHMILDIGKDLHHSEHYWLDKEQRQNHNAIWERIHQHASEAIKEEGGWLSGAEQQALTMPQRGTVTKEEMDVIASHDAMTEAFFAQAPLPPALVGVRNIVSMDKFRHAQSALHSLSFDEIIHVTDVFEALTADRSYRKAYSPEEALKVMDGMGKEGKLNSAIVESMRNNGTVEAYAQGMGLQHSPAEVQAPKREITWVERVLRFDPIAALLPSSWVSSVKTERGNAAPGLAA